MGSFVKSLMAPLCVLLVFCAVRAEEEKSSGDGSEVADCQAFEKSLAKRPPRKVINTNTVVRLGYELPNQVVLGKGGQQKVFAKGLLARRAHSADGHRARHHPPRPVGARQS